MELRQLRYFVTVAEEANFTRAAARLHLAQPGLSAQIKQLEHELGQPLLDRTSRSVTLTPVGEAVLPLARAALEQVERITQTVDEFTGLLRGHVRVGLIAGAALDEIDTAQVLADFHRDHPQIGISLTEDTSDAMYAALRRGGLDIGVLSISGDLDPVIGTETVYDSAIVAAVAADAEGFGERITLAELCAHPLISLPPGTGLRGLLENACAAAGLVPDVAFEAAAPPLLIRLAAHELGVAVIPRLPPQDAAALGVRTLEIDPPMRGRLVLAWNAERPMSPATKVLLGQLRIALTRWKTPSR
ncbi:LysR family transcriptional regulator [Nocardia seriolae]|uniref:LysR family transcriptional regulator n=1 Tax=Nocardia seriolae TaxID=37332 RepID=A0A0B8N783_9NOCA|nr:LysR family transcriptional regulator [Nocardia seriolae]MTJ62515.1 LysR family transcriptional regulator [Nocardia seriolae]MTJ72836.1 LysR family transcriptional regulator [Nocardia seriolae]MTJ87414.1 LysR family transcriptional regulator [Nocardia seriolae]MTK31405.1 LysR family transcriptional regulator [Nocardia seriolae]MTK40465.1 LysR family transcriptional regulator [Nocardia seriolae]